MQTLFILSIFVLFNLIYADDNGFIRYNTLEGKSYTSTFNKRSILINGKPSLFISGSVHPPRFPVDMWDDVLKSLKNDGLNMVDINVFWNYHEPEPGKFIWEGNANYTLFLELAAKNDLFVTIRLGPYVRGEWSYGGFPSWLGNIEGMRLRTVNEPFQREMKRYLLEVLKRIRHQFADKGGPIILAQIENEVGSSSPKEYIEWCGNLTEEFAVNVPWLMSSGLSAPNTINSCNGNNCSYFLEEHGQSGKILLTQPGIWTENEGWFQQWGEQTECYDEKNCQFPSRTPSELAFQVIRWFARGGDSMNYYMYQGGNNYGVTAGTMITTMFANNVNYHSDSLPNEPKHTHLKNLHKIISDNAEALVYDIAQYNHPIHLKYWNGIEYVEGDKQIAYEYKGHSKFVSFVENNDGQTLRVLYGTTTYLMSGYSSLIVDSNHLVLYNSNVLPTVPYHHASFPIQDGFVWKYWCESGNNLKSDGDVKEGNQLIEQISLTIGRTEYMYYETNITVNDDECELTLGGYVQNAYTVYIDNKLHFSDFHMEHYATGKRDYLVPFNQQKGTHKLTILSEHFGIADRIGPGPMIALHGLHTVTLCGTVLDQNWVMRSYLTGEIKKIFTESGSSKVMWLDDVIKAPPTSWFQTKFDSANLTDNQQYALNVSGLGRGHAYVNGHDLGRYSTLVGRGQTGPTQLLYFIPKSWIFPTNNLLTINEIIGVTNINLVSLSKTEMIDNEVEIDHFGFFLVIGITGGLILVGLIGSIIYFRYQLYKTPKHHFTGNSEAVYQQID